MNVQSEPSSGHVTFGSPGPCTTLQSHQGGGATRRRPAHTLSPAQCAVCPRDNTGTTSTGEERSSRSTLADAYAHATIGGDDTCTARDDARAPASEARMKGSMQTHLIVGAIWHDLRAEVEDERPLVVGYAAFAARVISLEKLDELRDVLRERLAMQKLEHRNRRVHVDILLPLFPAHSASERKSSQHGRRMRRVGSVCERECRGPVLAHRQNLCVKRWRSRSCSPLRRVRM